MEGERLIEKRHEHERRRKAASGLFFSSGGLAEVQARCRCNARTHRQQIRGFLTFDEHVSFCPRRTSEIFPFFFFFLCKLFATIREAGGEGSAKSAWRAAAICQHMLSFLSQSDHYGPIGNKQMSSSAWQSTMMNNHGCDGVTRVTGAPCHRDKVTQGDGGAADQTLRQAGGTFLFMKRAAE